jgi:acetyltransferase
MASEVPSLDSIFKPRNVAVIGATEKADSVGRTILKNLITNPFGGTVYPVNLKRPNVLGIHAYPSVLDIPVEVDLAVIVTPAKFVPGVIQECVDKGVRGAIVISAGFKEVGPEGAALEHEIMEIARGKMRIIGPNCLGVMLPLYGMNATFAGSMARPGKVAFVSQSGAICTAVLDWSFEENVGFSAFISIGSMLDVDWGDLIYYLGDDPHTESIVIYMETVGDARSFLSAAREVALKKPIIVIKAGRTAEAAKAAASHTGSLAGSDDVLDAAFRRSGVLRVDRISEVFYLSEALSKQPRPQGARLTIVTNAGGPGVLATDALIQGGGKLAEISDGTMEELNALLPAAWSHNNPIDILGDASPELYAKALEIASRDVNSDGLLVILTPQDMTDPTQTAEHLKPYGQIEGKPVLASWMGGADVKAGENILNRASIPTYAFPDTAVRLFNHMWRYSYNLQALYETPEIAPDDIDVDDRAFVADLIKRVRDEGRTILTEAESKQVLAAYNIPTIPMAIADSPEGAVEEAEHMGYPVVLKLHSETVTHKTDVDGVQLNLADAGAVVAAFERIRKGVTEAAGAEHFLGVSIQPMIKLDGFEIIIGSSVDAQFGPVLLFGTGGTLVEVFKDRALALPPLTSVLARRMMEQTKIYEALKGVRGRKPVDIEALALIMVRFSRLVVEQPWIKELDINPLLASPERLLALDARVVLHDPETEEEDLPKPAIAAYPIQYFSEWTSKSGNTFTLRPIRPEDERAMVRFHESLSEKTVQLRYFRSLSLSQRTTHARLAEVCFIDYARGMVFIAERPNPRGEGEEIAAVLRISKLHNSNQADFGIIVADRFQGQGIGTRLIQAMMEYARDEGIIAIRGYVGASNAEMLDMVSRWGFREEKRDGEVITILAEVT